MIIVDSRRWLEWFTDGGLAGEFEPYLTDQEKILVPAVIFYEVSLLSKRKI